MEAKSVLSTALPNHNCFEGNIIFLTTEKSRGQAKIVQKMVNIFLEEGKQGQKKDENGQKKKTFRI